MSGLVARQADAVLEQENRSKNRRDLLLAGVA
jgi:hypothetical protein